MSALGNGGYYDVCDCRSCKKQKTTARITVWYCPTQNEIYLTKFEGDRNGQMAESRSGVDTSRPNFLKEGDAVSIDSWEEPLREILK